MARRKSPLVFYPVKPEHFRHLQDFETTTRGLLVFQVYSELPKIKLPDSVERTCFQPKQGVSTLVQYPRHWRIVNKSLAEAGNFPHVLGRVLDMVDGLELLYYYKGRFSGWNRARLFDWFLASETLTLAEAVPIEGPCPTTTPKPCTTRSTSP